MIKCAPGSSNETTNAANNPDHLPAHPETHQDAIEAKHIVAPNNLTKISLLKPLNVPNTPQPPNQFTFNYLLLTFFRYFWYWCGYPHTLRYFVFLVCGIFFELNRLIQRLIEVNCFLISRPPNKKQQQSFHFCKLIFEIFLYHVCFFCLFFINGTSPPTS